MREDRRELLDEMLKNFKGHRHFETDKFLYWTKDDYCYNDKKVSREEFEHIKNYAVKHGTLPFISIEEKIKNIRDENKSNNQYSTHHDLVNTNTYSRQKMIRYSKEYENIDVYDYDIEVRSPFRSNIERVVVIAKKKKIFSVNDKNYVLINGNRWLSLKNWTGLKGRDVSGIITNKVAVMLLNMMLGGKEWVSKFEEPIPYFISNKHSRKANSLDEAISLECGMTPPKIIKRALKNDINDIINFYNIIDVNKIPYIINFIKRNHKNLSSLLEAEGYPRVDSLLYYFFLSKDNRCEKYIFHDYIRMIRKEGQKINLNISSYKSIRRNHDKISADILSKNKDNRRLKVSKVYPKIKSIPGLEVEMIRKSDRLNEESEILHHCVHGYKEKINRGECAIYSLVHEGERYTLQISSEKAYDEMSVPRRAASEDYVNELKITQLKGKYNCNAPKSLKIELEKLCEQYDIKLSSSIWFVDKIKEREERKAPVVIETHVKQIGEAILDSLISTRTQNKLESATLPF